MKVHLHVAAATLAGAVVSNLPDDLPADPNVQDAKLRTANLLAWELHRIFYHAMVAACDSTDWPTPKGEPGPNLNIDNLQSLITPLLANPAMAEILKGLISQIPELTKPPAPSSPPVPNPSA